MAEMAIGKDGAKVAAVGLLLTTVGLLVPPAPAALGSTGAPELDGPFALVSTYPVSGASPQVLRVAPDELWSPTPTSRPRRSGSST